MIHFMDTPALPDQASCYATPILNCAVPISCNVWDAILQHSNEARCCKTYTVIVTYRTAGGSSMDIRLLPSRFNAICKSDMDIFLAHFPQHQAEWEAKLRNETHAHCVHPPEERSTKV